MRVGPTSHRVEASLRRDQTGAALRFPAVSHEVRVRIRRRRWDAAVLLGGLAVLVACALVARHGTTGPLEQRVFRAVNGLPDALSPVMRRAQLLGVLAVGPVVGLIALVARRWRLAVAAFVVTVGKLLAERIVWHFVHRERPGTTIPGAIVRGNTPITGVSFVSGHVVALVAFARVYLGAHAPLDVLGGFALGLAVGGMANLIVGVPNRAGSAHPGQG